MGQKRNIMKAPQLEIQLLQSDWRTHHSHTQCLGPNFAQQTTGVQQPLGNIEVKFDPGHQGKMAQAGRPLRAAVGMA
jgi:hypothetical protein